MADPNNPNNPSNPMFSSSLSGSMSKAEKSISKMVTDMTRLVGLFEKFGKTAQTTASSTSKMSGVGSLGQGNNTALAGNPSFSNTRTMKALNGGAEWMLNNPVKTGLAVGAAQLGMAGMAAAWDLTPDVSTTMSMQRATFFASTMTGGNYRGAANKINEMTRGYAGTSRTDAYEAAGTLAMRGMNFAGNSMYMQNSGAMSALTGQSMQSFAGQMGANPLGANRMRMFGMSAFDKKGNALTPQQLGDQIYKSLDFKKGAAPADIIRDLTTPGYPGYIAIQYFVAPEQVEQVTTYLIAKATSGGSLTAKTFTADYVKQMGGGAFDIQKQLGQTAGAQSRVVASAAPGVTAGAVAGSKVAEGIASGVADSGIASTLGAMKGYMEAFGAGVGGGAVGAATEALKTFAQALLLTAATSAGAQGLGMAGGLGKAGAATAGAGAAAGSAGRLAKAGSVVARGARVAGPAAVATVASIGAGYASNALTKSGHSTAGKWASVGGDALTGAAIGATAGSFVPVIGNVVGGALGGIIGGAIGFANNFGNAGGAESETFSGGDLGSGGQKEDAARTNKNKKTGGATGSAVVAYARSFLGVKYVWGGNTPSGWDCSGFTRYIFKRFGVNLPRKSTAQGSVGKTVSMKDAQPGDLIVYNRGGGNGHVAIYAGGGRMVHAANRKLGTIESNVWGGYTTIRRVVTGGGGVGAGVGNQNNNNDNDKGIGEIQNPGTMVATGLSGLSISTGTSGISTSTSSVTDILNSGGDQFGGERDTSSGSSESSGTTAGSKASNTKAGNSSLAGAIRAAGFTGDLARTMWAIAMAESGGRANAHNPNASTGDNSYGLFQINMLGGMGTARRRQFGISSNEQLLDPVTNAKAAMMIYKQQGLNAWSTYKHGSHQKYLSQAPGFSKGAWKIDTDQVANIHQGEMILPSTIAQSVRDALSVGAGASNGGNGPSGQNGYGPVTIQVMLQNGSDAEVYQVGNKLKKVLTGERTLDSLRGT